LFGSFDAARHLLGASDEKIFGVSATTDPLSQLWEWFAENQCRGYSPIYERISSAVAHDTEVLELVRSSPPAAHMPPALLGAVHYLLLSGLEHPLAEVYSGRSNDDPGSLFVDLCRSRADEVAEILAFRRVQTNDCGRSALIGPSLTWLAAQISAPLALVDVGASAGLNLICDRYRMDYGSHGATGPTQSTVRIDCRVTGGDPPIAERLPEFATRVGIDRSPIDVADADDARWLLACVWPDTGRMERTAASIRLAQEDPPEVLPGDANEVLPQLLAGLPAGTAAIVMTTSAFAYLTLDERRSFVANLELASEERSVAWLSAEGQGTVEAFSGKDVPSHEETRADVLGVVKYERGKRSECLLGFVHQHGGWIDWRASGRSAA